MRAARPQMARDLAPDVLRLLSKGSPHERKKANLCVTRCVARARPVRRAWVRPPRPHRACPSVCVLSTGCGVVHCFPQSRPAARQRQGMWNVCREGGPASSFRRRYLLL